MLLHTIRFLQILPAISFPSLLSREICLLANLGLGVRRRVLTIHFWCHCWDSSFRGVVSGVSKTVAFFAPQIVLPIRTTPRCHVSKLQKLQTKKRHTVR